MSDPTLPPTPPEPSQAVAIPPAPEAPLPPYGARPYGAPMYPQPPRNQTPVLGIVAVVLSVFMAPIGGVLGIITLATAKGRRAAKILGSVAMIVGLAITAAVVVLIVMVVRNVQGAEHVSNEFLNDLQRGNTHAAFSLTSSEFRLTTSESALGNNLSAIESALDGRRRLVSTHIDTSTSEGTTTDLIYEIDGTEKSYVGVRLIKQGGNWQVSFFGPTNKP